MFIKADRENDDLPQKMRSFGYSIISNHEKSWKLISGFWSSCNFELGAAEKFVDLVDVEKSLMLKIECVSARLGFDTAENGQRKIWRIPRKRFHLLEGVSEAGPA